SRPPAPASTGRSACCWRSPPPRCSTDPGGGSRPAPATTADGPSMTTRATRPGAGARCRYAAAGPRRGRTTTAGARRTAGERTSAGGWGTARVSTVGPALTLALARARRRPWRALAPALGIALAAAFLGAVWAEGTIAGEQAARSVLQSLTPAQRAVTITWQGATTATVDRQARTALSGLGLGARGPLTTAALLNPVRLNGHVVRPAAIA